MGDQAVLAFDLGGTRIKAGIVVDHEVVLLRIVPTGDEQGFDHVLEQILSVGEGLLRERPATAIGLSLPAIVDVERGTVVDVRKSRRPDRLPYRRGAPATLQPPGGRRERRATLWPW